MCPRRNKQLDLSIFDRHCIQTCHKIKVLCELGCGKSLNKLKRSTHYRSCLNKSQLVIDTNNKSKCNYCGYFIQNNFYEEHVKSNCPKLKFNFVMKLSSIRV